MVNAAHNPAHHKRQHEPKHEARAWNRMRAAPGPANPYKIGDAVVGDDPFNGRHEGVVVSRTNAYVGVGTAQGVVYYDPRQVRRQE